MLAADSLLLDKTTIHFTTGSPLSEASRFFHSGQSKIMQPPDPSPEEQDFTIKDTLNYLKTSSSEYVQAKLQLAAIEAKEAANAGVKTAINAAILLVLALFSYMLLLASIIGAGSHLIKEKAPTLEQYIGTWPIITLGLLLLHILLVFIFVDKLKNAGKKAFFSHTKAELEKDKLWLQQLKSNSKSEL